MPTPPANTIVAKFRVHNVTPYAFASGEQLSERVQMSPVYSDDPNSENYSFSQATPSGAIELNITNVGAFGAFVVGAEYVVSFAPSS